MLNKYELPSTSFIQKISRELPGDPVVRTPHFHCQGPGVQALVGELRSHKLHGEAKKNPKTKKISKRHCTRASILLGRAMWTALAMLLLESPSCAHQAAPRLLRAVPFPLQPTHLPLGSCYPPRSIIPRSQIHQLSPEHIF